MLDLSLTATTQAS